MPSVYEYHQTSGRSRICTLMETKTRLFGSALNAGARCKHNKYRYQPRRQWERNPYPSASYDWQRTRLPMNSSNLCTSRRGNQARKKPTKPTPSSTDKATAPAGTNSVPPSDNPNEIDKHKNTQVYLQPGRYTFGVHFRASYRKTGNKKAPQPLRL